MAKQFDPENPDAPDSESVEQISKELWIGTESGKYFFVDECESLQGPYDTIADAMKGLNEYDKWLNGSEPNA